MSDKSILGILSVLLILLTLQIWVPALNRSLWQDDLDLLLLGRANGQISEEHPYPIHWVALDEDGKNLLFQPGWVWLNGVVDATGIPHSWWRLINVIFFVVALGLYSARRLKSFWVLAPVGLCLFSDFVFRSASLVRHYNIASLCFVISVLLLNSKYRKCFYLSLLVLWQSNTLAFICFGFVHCIMLVFDCFKKIESKKEILGLFVFYFITAIIQYNFNYELIRNNEHIPVSSSQLVRFQVTYLTYNTYLIPFVLLIPMMIWKKDEQSHFMKYLVIFTILISPILFRGYRSVYMIMFMPYLLVEFIVYLKQINKPWVYGVLTLVIFTNILSWPFNKIISYENPKYFYDQMAIGSDTIKTTPLRAWFESKHRKWSQIDALTTYIKENKKPGDRILYDLSRDSIMSHVAIHQNIDTTGIFPEHHKYFKKHPTSSLVRPQKPFWAVTPYIFGDKRSQWDRKDERVAFLKQYGKVTVHRVPKRNREWVTLDNYPPPPLEEPGEYVLYYVK